MDLPRAGEDAAGGISMTQVWRILLAHIWLSVGAFVVLAVLAFFVIKSLPKSYVATTALIVNMDNTDPLAGRLQGIGQAYTFFPTQVELINNNVVLRPVVDRLSLHTDENFTVGFVGDDKALHDVVLANLRSSLQVQQGDGSQMLYISASARESVRAAEIANAVAEEYLRQTGQRTNAPAVERATRYGEQMADLKSKSDAAQARVAAFRERHGLVNLQDGAGGDSEGAELADLQAKLLDAQNQLRQAESLQNNPEAISLRSSLSGLEAEMALMRTTRGPRHPEVIELQSQIDALRQALSGASATQVANARELVRRVEAQLAAARSTLLERRTVQDEGRKLLLEAQLAQEAYATALRGQDQVQFASEANYKDVTIVSRAEPPVKAARPNKFKLFVAAIFAIFMLSVGGPFAYEFFLKRRIRGREDLERGFRIMTLAEFDRIKPAMAG